MKASARREGTKRSGRAKQSLRLWLRLLSAHNLIEQYLRRRIQDRFGRTLPQFDVLSELEYAAEPQTMSQVSRRLMVSNGNVTGVVDRLERDGLVSRQIAPHDRRVQLLSLTPTGRELFLAMAAEHERWLDHVFGDLDSDALDATEHELHTLRDLIRNRISPSEEKP